MAPRDENIKGLPGRIGKRASLFGTDDSASLRLCWESVALAVGIITAIFALRSVSSRADPRLLSFPPWSGAASLTWLWKRNSVRQL